MTFYGFAATSRPAEAGSLVVSKSMRASCHRSAMRLWRNIGRKRRSSREGKTPWRAATPAGAVFLCCGFFEHCLPRRCERSHSLNERLYSSDKGAIILQGESEGYEEDRSR